MSTEMEKPVCGSGERVGAYDVPLHTAGLFVVLIASTLGAGFPVAAQKIKWLRIPPPIFFACKHFGTGVLVATAFVHLLPTAFISLTNPCLPDFFIKQYVPFPGVIMMASLFSLFVIELWLNSKMGGHSHSHGGALGFEAPPVATTHNHNHTHTHTSSPSVDSSTTEISSPVEEKAIETRTEKTEEQPQVVVCEAGSWLDVEGNPVDPLVYRRMNLNIALLEGGILFHSVFVGITVSITINGYITLLIAIIFHQVFEGLGLGSRIAAVPYKPGSIRPWLLVIAFGTTAPLGQAIGLAARNSYDPNSALGLILVGVFNAISSGLLIYAALVDLLAEDFLSEESSRVLTSKKKKIAFAFVLAGATAMAVIGAFA